ncbi:neither inactivation nor afterpotential protein G-like isoform X3 [Toxorhynchites rutilus septentrionalis]|uniref:neither inactivation nor afterpotential protein G-like isoform X3 n=1 Tax=Toxorhynchites rutilus septentrionalis TaxID=329112 RepID=UPI00247B10F1|nr:neither inactivation nor afterpotential protein G-like isoform X3 [Toxorhynchites rutilus septentrionalis]
MHFNLTTLATYVFYLLGTTFFCAILNGSYLFHKLYYSNTPSKRQYEYIIIGTGTAGSLIASGISSNDVLLIEAGSMGSSLMDIPLFQPLLQGTHYDWQYKTEPQSNACWALAENRSYWPMGKVFGGTSMLNNMIHYRAERHDFDGWFDDDHERDLFMKYFEEDWHEKSRVVSDELSFETKLGDAFMEAAASVGLDRRYFYRPKVATQQGIQCDKLFDDDGKFAACRYFSIRRRRKQVDSRRKSC